MLQVALIRENFGTYVEALQKRNIEAKPILEKVLQLDESRRATQTSMDEKLAESNKLSKEIGMLFKSGEAAKANELKAQTGTLKEETKTLGEQLNQFQEELNSLLFTIPNIPNPLVPIGNSDEDNDEVFREGDIPSLHEGALPHWELAKKYDLIDFELGVKVTGAGFPVYKGKGARLQRALINYFLDKNTAAGYQEVQVPHLVNSDSGFGTGQLPDKEGQMYHVTGDDLYLIPTAEVPITNIFRGEMLQENQLPICYTCLLYTSPSPRDA